MSATDHLDLEKPELKEDEAMCTGCWKVVKKNERAGWVFYNFKHLSPQNLCPPCIYENHAKFELMQRQGL